MMLDESIQITTDDGQTATIKIDEDGYAIEITGTLGIDLTQAAPFPTLILPQPAGVGSVSWTLPNVPGLIGQELYSQALLVAYPNDLHFSNVLRDVIQ